MYLFVIIVLCIVIVGSLYYRYKKDEQLRSEGKTIKRSMGFMEKAEFFTLNLDNPERITSGVQSFPYSEMKVSVKSDSSKQSFRFSNSYEWSARLYRVENHDDKATYCFELLNWKTHNGAVLGGLYMNMLQTAVEKLFLSIDPNTQVQEKLLNTTTKHKFFY